MYRSSLGLSAAFLLLASCAQTPPKAADTTAQVDEAANRQSVIFNVVTAHEPQSTHPVEQDITYNSRYQPHFPIEAIKAGHYGRVTLLIAISAKGEIGDIRVEASSGYPELDASAIDAAKHWAFIPEEKNGVPQPGYIRIPVSFDRPIPPPHSPDGLLVGVSTKADALILMGTPGGTMQYTSGMTDLIWGNRSVGVVILRFDAAGMLTKVYKSKPAS